MVARMVVVSSEEDEEDMISGTESAIETDTTSEDNDLEESLGESKECRRRSRRRRRGTDDQYKIGIDRGSQLSRTPVRSGTKRLRERHVVKHPDKNGMIAWSDIDLEANEVNEVNDDEAMHEAPVLSFDKIAGLDDYLVQLKEMVILPLVCPEIFKKLKILPPRGVIFHGPPGTGKTLLARILASTCTKLAGRKVSFFHRNGSECLSKWIGEAEQNLAKLFREAKQSAPSIIFFDEIDGMAPDRSGGGSGGKAPDQSHVSLVSMLLSLMDGLEDRGSVIVIGATNRLDSIDPALRRPGRFDKEFYFGLPNKQARSEIFKIFDEGLGGEVLERLAGETDGYSGADIKGLCTEAALQALRRCCPQLYSLDAKFENLVDLEAIRIEDEDYWMALKSTRPHHVVKGLDFSLPRPLESLLDPLLTRLQENIQSSPNQMISKEQTIRNPIVCIAFNDEEFDVDIQPGDYQRCKRKFLLSLARRLVQYPSQVACLDGAGLLRESQGMTSIDAALFTAFKPDAFAGRVLVCPDLDRIASFVSAEGLACFLDDWAMTDVSRLIFPMPGSLELDHDLYDLHALNFDLVPQERRETFLQARFPPLEGVVTDLADIVGVATHHDGHGHEHEGEFTPEWLSSFPRATYLYYNRPH